MRVRVGDDKRLGVSIHAPVKGATVVVYAEGYDPTFQSTPP